MRSFRDFIKNKPKAHPRVNVEKHPFEDYLDMYNTMRSDKNFERYFDAEAQRYFNVPWKLLTQKFSMSKEEIGMIDNHPFMSIRYGSTMDIGLKPK